MKKNWWKYSFRHSKCGQESTVVDIYFSQDGMRFKFACVICGEEWFKDYLYSFFPARAAVGDYKDEKEVQKLTYPVQLRADLRVN